MTVEALLIIVGLCLFCCYFVFEYQRAAVPPYQEPLKPEPVAPEPDMAEKWVAATTSVRGGTLDNIDNWNAKIGDKIWYKQDEGALSAAQIEQIEDTVQPTVLNPKAAWPFPSGSKP
jgi:uncharacterized membrane protein